MSNSGHSVKLIQYQSVVNEPVHLNPEIGWDKDVLSYFNHWMTEIEHNNKVWNGNGIKVTVELDIRYEHVGPVVIDKEEAEQELLRDLQNRVSVLEQQVLAVLACYL